MMTWRRRASWVFERNSRTVLSSFGSAVTVTRPACGFMITDLPSPVPMRPLSAASRLFQRSFSEVVVMSVPELLLSEPDDEDEEDDDDEELSLSLSSSETPLVVTLMLELPCLARRR